MGGVPRVCSCSAVPDGEPVRVLERAALLQMLRQELAVDRGATLREAGRRILLPPVALLTSSGGGAAQREGPAPGALSHLPLSLPRDSWPGLGSNFELFVLGWQSTSSKCNFQFLLVCPASWQASLVRGPCEVRNCKVPTQSPQGPSPWPGGFSLYVPQHSGCPVPKIPAPSAMALVTWLTWLPG